MTQTTSVKKSAYAAIGAPGNLAAALRDRISAARAAFDEYRDRLPDQSVAAFDEWAADGERLIEAWADELRERRRALEGTVRVRTQPVREVGRGLAATVSEGVAPIEAVDGIGPVLAERLIGAGVPTTAALLERCRSAESTAVLADQTGISISLLTGWAESADLTRVDGVGDQYRSMLNDLGVPTVEALADADPGDLHVRASELHSEGESISAVPSEETFGHWIERASALVA